MSGDEDLYTDVITLENSRSIMELLKNFSKFYYPNKIGKGGYDIFYTVGILGEEIFDLIQKDSNGISIINIWINPYC
ncbi:hypothetical protein [Blattabacterium punctulatus]|uniref:hypothetical protein n=1 Tax=Blattabacterium punctulatus TaxID=164514 RepID=UPI0021D278C7|nr:hypothetical protein [Blattabacterium punctulatus]